jgi:DNA-binding NtrC family response regulator/tetratricopeptide (TPR) repeat protein
MQSAGTRPTDRLDGRAPAIEALRTQIGRLAAFDAVGGRMVPTLLLQGETGTGKGLVARMVHEGGPRAAGPFIPVNCAAIPDTMLEAELFGFEAGAFTDARRSKPGLFEAASGGTLFLDEIDSLSLALQGKLLTAIEGKHIRRLGAVAEHEVDVKLVVATQQDLSRLVAEGRFRADLYHRLAVVVLVLPPLRERGDDVLLLARSMLERFAEAYDTVPKRLARDAEAWLRRYPWPGNVRELGHVMERVTLLHPDATIGATALEALVRPAGERARDVPAAVAPTAEAPEPTTTPAVPMGAPAEPTGTPDEPGRLRDALARTGGNVLKAARLLGVTRDTLRYRMRRYGVARPRLEDAPPVREALDRPTAAGSPVPTAGARALAWEQKPAAIVAVEVTWRDPEDDALPSHEPWTEAARWERRIHEKLAGLGGVLVQRGPSLSVWGFGVPQSLDQMPQRAVQGALAVRNLAESATTREHVPELRLAVHLGRLIVDVGAADPAARVLSVGDTLRVPVRLLGASAPGDVVVSTEVARLVEAWVVLEPIEPRGAGRHPVLGYRALGIRRSDERSATRERPASPFVGRQHELATLRELLDGVATSTGHLVGIVGDPGAGKSRLLVEFEQLVRARGVRYVEVHCVAYGTATPYLPLIEMLREALELAELDPPAIIADRAQARFPALGLDPRDAALVPPLLTGGVEAADGQQLKARTFEMFRQLAFGAAPAQPLVLAFENVHWIDPTSAQWLVELAGRLQGRPLLLLLTYRPGYQLPALGQSYVSQIALRPLSVEASRSLLRSIVGDAPLPPETEELVVSRAEGNPFFLEELGHAVVEHGGRHPLAVPDTVHAVLAARIDRLAPEDKSVLQAAAVIGRHVPIALLEAVAGLSEPALAPRLARLVTAEFLVESAPRPQLAYRFRHALTQAAAAAGLAPDVRKALHLKVAEALEGRTGDVRPEQVEQFAHHAAEGGAWEKAIGYLRRAASVAAARGARREVVVCYRRALDILEKLPPDATAREESGDVRFRLAHAHYMAGEFARSRDHFDDARVLAEKADDTRLLAQVLTGLCYVHASEGRYGEAAEAGERAQAIAAGDLAVSLWTSFGLARAHFALGNYRRAVECARWAIDALEPFPVEERLGGRAGNLLPAVAARTWLAVSLGRLGEFDDACRYGEEAVRAAETVEGLQERVWAYYCLGRVLHSRTDFDRAIPFLREAMRLCEGGTIPIYVTRVRSGLGAALTQSGDLEGGLPLLHRALDEARTMNSLYGHALIVLQIARACVDAGRLDEADARAAEALALARQRGERGDEAWALLVLAEIAAERKPAALDRARGWIDQALALGHQIGMRPLVARSLILRGALERASRGDDAAASTLAEAATALRTMGIARWLARAERLLGEVTGREQIPAPLQ